MNAYEERVMGDDGCLSGDPECANGPRPSHTAALCSACVDREESCPVCGEPDCGYDAEQDICPNATGYRISR